jgi:hypothetical protein
MMIIPGGDGPREQNVVLQVISVAIAAYYVYIMLRNRYGRILPWRKGQ